MPSKATLKLLNKDAELREATSIEDITAVMETVNAIFEKLFKESQGSGKIMVQIELVEKGKPNIQFAVRDGIDDKIMAVFEQDVQNASYPNTRNRPITFQLIYKVNAFNEENQENMPPELPAK